jgi:nucleoid DNA-binding protein
MTKFELIERIAQKARIPHPAAEAVVRVMFDSIEGALVRGAGRDTRFCELRGQEV